MQKSYFFKSLGCPKNEVDGDIIVGYLRERGLVEASDPEQADYLIVNTCAFIQSAKEESIEEILKLAAVKNSNGRQQRLLVSGCLSQRYPNELLTEIPEVDGMIGIDQYDKIESLLDADMAYVSRPPSSYKEAHSHQIIRERPFAYLKIADGCDCRCSYCAIPAMRGDFRSRSLEAISADVDRMLAAGVVELNLIAQDVAYFGYDIGKHPLDLLRMLDEKQGEFWVRPFYLHPLHMDDEILDYLATSPKYCQYLESPIQHISPKLLKRMNRGYDDEHVYAMIERLRRKLPETMWRTTFIVGFPGETKRDFDQLCDFVVEQKIARAGVFEYSHEDGTPAYKYKGTLSEQEIRERQEELERLINENAEDYNRTLLGKERLMIVEEYDREAGVMRGRLSCDAPEIDFTVRVPVLAPSKIGFQRVRLLDLADEGFLGEFTGGEDGTRFDV